MAGLFRGPPKKGKPRTRGERRGFQGNSGWGTGLGGDEGSIARHQDIGTSAFIFQTSVLEFFPKLRCGAPLKSGALVTPLGPTKKPRRVTGAEFNLGTFKES